MGEYGAGPQLDELLISTVLEYPIVPYDETAIGQSESLPLVAFLRPDGWYGRSDWEGRFSPSTDWRAVGLIVEHLMDLQFTVQIFPGERGSYAHAVIKVPQRWLEVERQRNPNIQWHDLDYEGFHMSSGEIPSVPLAICRAVVSLLRDPAG